MRTSGFGYYNNYDDVGHACRKTQELLTASTAGLGYTLHGRRNQCNNTSVAEQCHHFFSNTFFDAQCKEVSLARLLELLLHEVFSASEAMDLLDIVHHQVGSRFSDDQWGFVEVIDLYFLAYRVHFAFWVRERLR